MENTEKQKTETTKFDGISAQINLSPGSETHRRFAQLMREAGAATSRSFVETLMDAYQNRGTVTDNSEEIERLQSQLSNLSEEVSASHNLIEKQDQEIANLKEQLEAAQNEANANAEKGLGLQLQLDEMKINGAIIMMPNPVSRFFLDEMSEKTKTEKGKILEKLFFDDLQNPRSNNLPYTVSASRIYEVMEKLKNTQNG